MTGEVADANQRLSAQFNAVLCVSRFAHCVKMLGRDMVGSFQDADRDRAPAAGLARCSTPARIGGGRRERRPLAAARRRGRGAGEAGPARRLRLHHPAAAAFPAGRGGRCLPAGHRSHRAEGRSMSNIGDAFQTRGPDRPPSPRRPRAVKAAPRDAGARWLLTEMLLFAGEVERADRTLDSVIAGRALPGGAGIPPAAAGRGGAPAGLRRRPRAEIPGRRGDAGADRGDAGA